MKKRKAVKKAWTIKHGRFVFVDYVRSKKQASRDAYAKNTPYTWKRLYAMGARVVPCAVSFTVQP